MEASQEAALEDLLDRISSKWNSIDLTVVPFKDVKDTFILGSVEDVTAALEDSMVTMSTILASRQVHLPCSRGQRPTYMPSTAWHTQLDKTKANSTSTHPSDLLVVSSAGLLLHQQAKMGHTSSVEVCRHFRTEMSDDQRHYPYWAVARHGRCPEQHEASRDNFEQVARSICTTNCDCNCAFLAQLVALTCGLTCVHRFVGGVKAEVERVDRQLHLFSDTLDEWLACQKDWMYLKTIFSAPDIQRQLPHEAKAFVAVDKQFKDVMRRTRERSNAMQAATAPGSHYSIDAVESCTYSLCHHHIEGCDGRCVATTTITTCTNVIDHHVADVHDSVEYYLALNSSTRIIDLETKLINVLCTASIRVRELETTYTGSSSCRLVRASIYLNDARYDAICITLKTLCTFE